MEAFFKGFELFTEYLIEPYPTEMPMFRINIENKEAKMKFQKRGTADFIIREFNFFLFILFLDSRFPFLKDLSATRKEVRNKIFEILF